MDYITMNSSQYMHYHSDYLHPLPTTLDVKKSPLALLAQTCSSIGKDVVPTKSNSAHQEKKDGDKTDKPVNIDRKEHLSPTLKKEHTKETAKPGFRTVPPKDIPPLVPIQNESSDSPNSEHKLREKSPAMNSRPVSTGSKNSPVSTPAWPQSREIDIHEHHARMATSTPIHTKPNTISPSHTQPSSISYGTIKPSSHPLYSGLHASPQLGYPGQHYHGLSAEAAAIYQSQMLAYSGLHAQGLQAASAAAAVAQQQSAIKAGAAAAASMNPYVSYTRVRTPSGATTLVPVCKDPYCTNCQLTVQTSHSSTTCKTPGCSQCSHEKALIGLSSTTAGLGLPGNLMSLYPQLASYPASATGLSSLSSLHSLYPHSALSAHQGLPYVCNWVAGHDYCGKRFNSSEDLMQHLRSHTSSIESALSAGYGLGLPSAASVGLGHLGGSAPISPNSLRRAYPTSISPGLLSNSRFHPYKSHLGGVAAPHSSAHLPLSAYYAPYSSIYGPRLGAVP